MDYSSEEKGVCWNHFIGLNRTYCEDLVEASQRRRITNVTISTVQWAACVKKTSQLVWRLKTTPRQKVRTLSLSPLRVVSKHHTAACHKGLAWRWQIGQMKQRVSGRSTESRKEITVKQRFNRVEARIYILLLIRPVCRV